MRLHLLGTSAASAPGAPALNTVLVHYPGLAAGLWQSGGGSFETAVGVSDRRSVRRLRLDDRFPIGSVTKTMTATLVLQLVERGKLRLGDSVRRYVGWIPHGGQITIRELLNMTSGIHNYPGGLIDACRRDAARGGRIRGDPGGGRHGEHGGCSCGMARGALPSCS